MDVSIPVLHVLFDNVADVASLARTLLLTHARAVDVYRKEFKQRQQGVIGITLVSLLKPAPR